MAKNTWLTTGKTHPYFGVLSNEKFLSAQITNEAKEEFFETGDSYIERLLKKLDLLKKDEVLDFGCGVGRLLLPLSGHFKEVVGVDISPTMLREAEKNASERGLTNISFHESIDPLPKASFDLVHSFIVLQHIPPKVGYRLLEQLIELIKPGGTGALHLTFHDNNPFLKRWGLYMRKQIPLFHKACNLLQIRPLNRPHIPMYTYSLSRVFILLEKAGIQDLRVELTDHKPYSGALLSFRRH